MSAGDKYRNMVNAYPEDIFRPFDKHEITAYSAIITRASAAMGRHCAKLFSEAADEIDRLESQAKTGDVK